MYAPVIQKPLTFEEFLAWDDGSGRDFELRDGLPMPFSDPNANHEDVADDLSELLADHCKDLDLPYVPKRSKQVKVRDNPVTGKEESRKADIVVFAKDEWQRLKASPSSAAAYNPPPLVIEVVSTNWRDDYNTKLLEYEETGIPEYWVVDYAGLGGVRFIGKPKQPTITIYQLIDGEYQPRQFRGDEVIESLTIKGLTLTANQILLLEGSLMATCFKELHLELIGDASLEEKIENFSNRLVKKKLNNQTEFKKLEEPDRKGLVLSDYISAIAEIPDSVLRLHGLLLEPLNSDPQGALILGCREVARIKVLWLEYFLLNKVEHLSELSLPMVALGKSEAEVSVANLRLVQEVYKRGDPNYLTFISPAHWWFLCEWDYYKSAMQHNGLMGDPLLIGKRELTNQVSDWLKELKDPRRWIQNGEDLADDAVVSPLTALVMVALSIAAEDRRFCITHWLDYLRVMKRSNRTFRNDPKRPIAYLATDGTFRVFERGKGKKS